MSKEKFEQDLRALLTDHEVNPPTWSWLGILRKLNRDRYYLGGGALLLTALISFSLWWQDWSEATPMITEGNFQTERLIMMIDSSYYEDGSLRIDTIFQELPSLDTARKRRLRAPKEIEESWVIADPEHPDYVDEESYLRGQQLFRNYCATCHVVKKDIDLTGPSLVGITARREQQWLYDFTRNSQKMIEEGDPQAVALWEDWQPTVMNNFEQLKDPELKDIYYYVANWEISGD